MPLALPCPELKGRSSKFRTAAASGSGALGVPAPAPVAFPSNPRAADVSPLSSLGLSNLYGSKDLAISSRYGYFTAQFTRSHISRSSATLLGIRRLSDSASGLRP